MKTIKCARALIAVAGVLAFASASLAATPTQADFDACNKEAQARGSSPAASPGTSGSPADTKGAGESVSGGTFGSTSGSTADTKGAGESVSAGTSGSTSGSTAGTKGAGESSVSGGTSGSTSGPSVSGGASTSTGADATLRGMAGSGQSDPAYQQAYRDCMKRRGF
jgi:hypothetical protein